jgi:hypothetical protein
MCVSLFAIVTIACLYAETAPPVSSASTRLKCNVLNLAKTGVLQMEMRDVGIQLQRIDG